MEIISNLISYDLAEPLGWTILHSLWQGLLIAASVYLLHRFIRDKYGNLKYWVSVAGMLVLFCWSISTFNHYSTKVEFAWTFNTFQHENQNLVKEIYNPFVNKSFNNNTIADKIERTFIFFESKIPLIVLLWFSGIAMFSTRLMLGMLVINKLKKSGTKKVDDAWHDFFMQLTEKIGLKRKVGLFESVKIDIPMVLGFFKPVILVPVGFFSNLSPQQVEAILVHELSHVKRHDFLVNVIQSVLEVMFFFNPFVWWMSNSIREERENCCDDLAISICKDPIAYSRALTTIHEAALPGFGLSIGLANNRNHLLRRIKRYNKIITAMILLLTLVASYLYSQKVFSIQPEYGQMIEAKLGIINEDPANLEYAVKQKTIEIPDVPPIPKFYPIIMATKESLGVEQDTGKNKTKYKQLLQSMKLNEIMREEMMQRMQADMLQMQEEMVIMQKQELQKLTEFFRELKKNNELEELSDWERLEFKKSIDLSRRRLEKFVREQMMVGEEEFLKVETLRLRLLLDEQLIRFKNEMFRAKEEFARIHEGEMKEGMEKLKDHMEDLKEEMAEMEKKHKAFEKELREELVKDGYLESPTERFEMEIDGKEVYINRKKINEKDAKKYIKIKNKYFEDKGGTFKIHH